MLYGFLLQAGAVAALTMTVQHACSTNPSVHILSRSLPAFFPPAVADAVLLTHWKHCTYTGCLKGNTAPVMSPRPAQQHHNRLLC